MDIELLAKMVGELILDHDEVALPGLGTFVAEMVPASFSDKGFTINPPYRKLSFRQREGTDRCLIDFYAQANKVDRTAAERMISQFIDGLRTELTSKKVVVFPKLGKLRATRENHFFFVPDEDLSIYPEGFGLIPVSLKSHQESQEEVSEAIRNLKDIVSPQDDRHTADAPAVPSAQSPVPPEHAELPVHSEQVAQPAAPETALPEMEKELKPEPASEPQVITEPVPAEATSAAVSPASADSRQHRHGHESSRRRGMHPAVAALLVAAGLAAVFFCSLAVLGRVAPQLIDPLLYSPEELRIINM